MIAWRTLATDPLFSLLLTLGAYQAGVAAQVRLRGHVLANPVLIAILLIVGFLEATGIPYADYRAGAGSIFLALGPATVALAVPLYAHARQMRGTAPRLLLAVVLGASVASGSAVALAWMLGAPDVLVRSIAPKSVTTAIAMGVSLQIGGLPGLTGALVILTGIGGAMFGDVVLGAAGITDRRARGLAIGVAAHAIGTASALARDDTEGAYAGLGMTLSAILVGLLMPMLWAALR